MSDPSETGDKFTFNLDTDSAENIPADKLTAEKTAKYIALYFYEDELQEMFDKLSPEATLEVKKAMLGVIAEREMIIEPDSFEAINVISEHISNDDDDDDDDDDDEEDEEEEEEETED